MVCSSAMLRTQSSENKFVLWVLLKGAFNDYIAKKYGLKVMRC
jgi:hypothetical protein